MAAKKRHLPTTGGADQAPPAISADARKAFLGGSQVQTAPPKKAEPMKQRIFRFAQEDDERLAGLVARLDMAQVRPIPSNADVVRAGLRALAAMSDDELMGVF